MNNYPIDVVIPWVDGSDKEWQKEKAKYSGEGELGANTEIRYQDWGNLKYLFRALEKNMPWVNKVFLITWGHIPQFLNTDNPKVRIVNHKEYIPEEFLPTFNSNTIELNVHRIKDLSENFILFNDDLFPLKFTEEDYYFINDLPCDQAIESPIMPVDIGDLSRWSCMVKTNNLLVINKHFKKREVQKNNFRGWYSIKYGERLKRNIGLHYWNNFVGFHDPHMANAIKKSTLANIWDIEPELLKQSSNNKFRESTDLSQYLVRYWQLCTNEFVPRKTLGKPYTVTINNYQSVAEDIRSQKWQMISLSEQCDNEEFQIIRKSINDALEYIFPEKSMFEK